MGGSNAADAARGQQKQQEEQINKATGKINTAFQGFTPQFYQKRTQDFENYALPQLNQQYGDTANKLGFKLSNQGLTNSSQATNMGEKLGQTYNVQKQGVANQGIQQAQSLQQQIEDERSRLVSQANAAADPLSIAGQAIGSASQFAAPSAFQPIGNMFQGFANMYLANQLNNAYSPQGGMMNQFNRPSYGLNMPTQQLG